MIPEELLSHAVAMERAHDPEHQEGNGYDRCALCHYEHNPCDVRILAQGVIDLSGGRDATS